MGVAGAALATLISRIFCAVVVLAELRLDRQPIVVRDYLKIRPDWRTQVQGRCPPTVPNRHPVPEHSVL